jgi:hypothetical protein
MDNNNSGSLVITSALHPAFVQYGCVTRL